MSPLLLSLLTLAAPQGTLSLQDARASALKSRPELVIIGARQTVAEAKVATAKAAERPKFAAKLDVQAAPGGELVEVQNDDGETLLVSGTHKLSDGSDAFQPTWSYGASVVMSWDIYDFGRTGAAKQAARAAVYARRAEAAHTRSQLLKAVDAAYLSWVSAHQRAAQSKAAAARVARQLADLGARIEAGALPESARISGQADEASAELRLAYAEAAEHKTRRALEQASGRTIPEGSAPDLSILKLGALQRTEGEDMELSALGAKQRAAEASARQAARADNPVLSASALLGLRGQSSSLFPLYKLGLGLSFPLWDGGASEAAERAARAQAKAARAAREKKIKERTAEHEAASEDLKLAERRVGIAERLLKLSEARLSDAESRYTEGAATAEELSRARERHAQASGELLTAQLSRAEIALTR